MVGRKTEGRGEHSCWRGGLPWCGVSSARRNDPPSRVPSCGHLKLATQRTQTCPYFPELNEGDCWITRLEVRSGRTPSNTYVGSHQSLRRSTKFPERLEATGSVQCLLEQQYLTPEPLTHAGALRAPTAFKRSVLTHQMTLTSPLLSHKSI